ALERGDVIRQVELKVTAEGSIRRHEKRIPSVRAFGGLFERVDGTRYLVPPLLELVQRPLVPRRVPRARGRRARPLFDLGNGLAPELDRQVVALPRLAEGGQRLRRLAQ